MSCRTAQRLWVWATGTSRHASRKRAATPSGVGGGGGGGVFVPPALERGSVTPFSSCVSVYRNDGIKGRVVVGWGLMFLHLSPFFKHNVKGSSSSSSERKSNNKYTQDIKTQRKKFTTRCRVTCLMAFANRLSLIINSSSSKLLVPVTPCSVRCTCHPVLPFVR